MRHPSTSCLALAAVAALLGCTGATDHSSPVEPTTAGSSANADARAGGASDAPAPEFEQYELVLLVRPADAPELPKERLEEIQAGHLAHLTKLGEAGHIVIAGPFSDQQDERLRGLCLYRTGSIERARELAQADPAVQAARLEVQVMTWWVEKGYMTFPRAPAPVD